MSQAAIEAERRKKRGQSRVLLVDIDHPDGVVYFNTGYRHLTFEGQIWLGVGLISEITFPEDSSSLTTERGTARLSGVDPEFRYLTENSVRYRRFRIRKAHLNADYRVVGTRVIEDAVCDTIDWQESEDDTGAIVVSFIGKFAFFAQQMVRRRTPEHHKRHLQSLGLDPSIDTGFDRQATIVDENPAWFPPEL